MRSKSGRICVLIRLGRHFRLSFMGCPYAVSIMAMSGKAAGSRAEHHGPPWPAALYTLSRKVASSPEDRYNQASAKYPGGTLSLHVADAWQRARVRNTEDIYRAVLHKKGPETHPSGLVCPGSCPHAATTQQLHRQQRVVSEKGHRCLILGRMADPFSHSCQISWLLDWLACENTWSDSG